MRVLIGYAFAHGIEELDQQLAPSWHWCVSHRVSRRRWLGDRSPLLALQPIPQIVVGVILAGLPACRITTATTTGGLGSVHDDVSVQVQQRLAEWGLEVGRGEFEGATAGATRLACLQHASQGLGVFDDSVVRHRLVRLIDKANQQAGRRTAGGGSSSMEHERLDVVVVGKPQCVVWRGVGRDLDTTVGQRGRARLMRTRGTRWASGVASNVNVVRDVSGRSSTSVSGGRNTRRRHRLTRRRTPPASPRCQFPEDPRGS